MKKTVSALVCLLLTLISVSWIFAQKPKATQPTSGMFYKITGKGLKKPSYIFGTIHIICPTDMFSLEKLNAHLNLTDQLLMEVDLDDPAVTQAMMSNVSLKGGKTIKDYLTPEEYVKVDELFKNRMGISVENFKAIKPYMLSVLLVTSPKAIGCQQPSSYDMLIMQSAVAKKKPLEGLETVESQIAAIEKTPIEKQVKDLYKMALEPQKSIDQFNELLKIYKSQNSDGLYSFTSKLAAKDSEGLENLLDERNKAWIPKIEKAIKEKSTFIAVGGGHLGGKNGVITLLKARGYKLQPIRL